MSKPRLAFFTPLNPMRSGISDYSEELLPYLGQLATIDVVVGDYEPSNPAIRSFEIIRAAEFQRRSARYDSVIYHLGNNLEYHGYMVPCMATAPGVVVLHDYSLSYLVLGLTLLRGDFAALRDVLARQYGTRSAAIARRLLFSLEDPYQLSLAAPMVDRSRGIIVHNEFAWNWLRREFPEVHARVIPHGITIQELAPADPSVRRRYGLEPQDLVLASVSTLAYNKRLETVVSCLPALRRKFPNLKLLLASGGRMGPGLRRKIDSLRLENAVVQTGWLPWDEYRRVIRNSDVVVNLRYPTAGETSGSALRAMEEGRPLIVSDHGSFRELPDDACFKIPVGEQEGPAFLKAAEALLENAVFRAEMGNAARQFVCRHLRMEDAAARYMEFITEVAAKEHKATHSPFPPLPANGIRGTLFSSVYKACRLRYVYRHYGIRDVLDRVSSRRRTGEPG